MNLNNVRYLMKKVRFIIFLLLIPFAIFLSSCNNDIPEEFLLEVDPASTANYDTNDPFRDIDYFLLTLYKVDLDEVVTEPTAGTASTVSSGTPIFTNERLNKGDVMRLENLEPGYYSLDVQMVGFYSPYFVNGSVTVKSNNSITVPTDNGGSTEYIVIEPDVQTIIKFVIKLDQA